MSNAPEMRRADGTALRVYLLLFQLDTTILRVSPMSRAGPEHSPLSKRLAPPVASACGTVRRRDHEREARSRRFADEPSEMVKA